MTTDPDQVDLRCGGYLSLTLSSEGLRCDVGKFSKLLLGLFFFLIFLSFIEVHLIYNVLAFFCTAE